ncbi:hypothetical protein GLOTRDRAFT_121636 [Gloeophyllum trabeum ATCC 11539]|uniref:F-box domain-containing protein n=1 Tax=Gloeophyllum trabeum (strain ATCC 11539 / FP-39264 / Madison 617) TaxID=670483 RepID=S7Q4R7_GLOTA|nr:uncharacterized protein GLOTRDRAFT_121636 [Gloeophyllum trabeum ATCC 11539]EPQ54503.1 hypothetical protein GLOTRDRAFT_121636 [Gloeophyllum trabeum ATCC 11539]
MATAGITGPFVGSEDKLHSKLLNLPGDLVDYILDYARPRDVARLCRVAKGLHAFAHRALYRDVFMTTPARMVKCCETLAANPSAAREVRTVSIRFRSSRSRDSGLGDSYGVVEAAFLSLPDVLALEIIVTTQDFVHILAKCRWPRLRRFQSFLPTLPELLTFMAHHPTLRSVFFSFQCNPATLSPILLPNAEKFIGPSQLVPLVIPGSRTNEVNLVSQPTHSQLESALIAMQQSTATVTSFSLLVQDWDVDHLTLISKYLPELETLDIRNSWARTGPDNPSSRTIFLCTLSPFLKDFTKLESLKLVSDDDIGEDISLAMALLDIEAVIVGGFGLACPTLSTCTMTSGVTWFKLQSCLWIPRNDRPIGRAWVRYLLETGLHPIVKSLDKESAELMITSIRNVLQSNPEWYGEDEDAVDSDEESDPDDGYGFISDHDGLDDGEEALLEI